MITKEQIQKGIQKDVIRFVVDPNGCGTVCQIGEYWFYFGGFTADEEEPESYLKNTPKETIVEEVAATLDDFRMDGAAEYGYYEAVLVEAGL